MKVKLVKTEEEKNAGSGEEEQEENCFNDDRVNFVDNMVDSDLSEMDEAQLKKNAEAKAQARKEELQN